MLGSILFSSDCTHLTRVFQKSPYTYQISFLNLDLFWSYYTLTPTKHRRGIQLLCRNDQQLVLRTYNGLFGIVNFSSMFTSIDDGVGASDGTDIAPKTCGTWISSLIYWNGGACAFVYTSFLKNRIATLTSKFCSFLLLGERCLFFPILALIKSVFALVSNNFSKGTVSHRKQHELVSELVFLSKLFSSWYRLFVLGMVRLAARFSWRAGREFSAEVFLVKRNSFMNEYDWWTYTGCC